MLDNVLNCFVTFSCTEQETSHPLTDVASSQNVFQYPLLFQRQTCWEFDIVCDDELSSGIWLLAERHALVWKAFLRTWLSRTRLFKVDLLAVDGCNCPLPTCEGFFEVQFDCAVNVVSIPGEERVWFLESVSV